MKKDIYLIQICDGFSVLEQKYVIGQENAEKVYNSLNPAKGSIVTMNKAAIAFNGELTRGSYIKQTTF